jgi:hypothetical protein
MDVDQLIDAREDPLHNLLAEVQVLVHSLDENLPKTRTHLKDNITSFKCLFFSEEVILIILYDSIRKNNYSVFTVE